MLFEILGGNGRRKPAKKGKSNKSTAPKKKKAAKRGK